MTKIATTLLGFCIALSSSAAIAAPVYLQCQYAYKGVDHTLAITLNEESALATVVERDRTKRVAATFSPERVVIEMGGVDPRYIINRVNLDFVADWKAYFGPVSAQGKCTIPADPARKF